MCSESNESLYVSLRMSSAVSEVSLSNLAERLIVPVDGLGQSSNGTSGCMCSEDLLSEIRNLWSRSSDI